MCELQSRPTRIFVVISVVCLCLDRSTPLLATFACVTSSAFAPTIDLTIGPRLFVFPWTVVDICAGALDNSISVAGVRTSPRSVLQGHERVFVFVVLPRGLRAATETERAFLVFFVLP